MRIGLTKLRELIALGEILVQPIGRKRLVIESSIIDYLARERDRTGHG